jgi:polyvinyl alcohol dehydrogenase (cytochrome)
MPQLRSLVASAFVFASLAAAQDGATLFQKNCATCHKTGGANRAPLPEALAHLPKDGIVASLTSGSMKAQGAALSAAERNAIADYLVAKNTDKVETARSNACPSAAAPLADFTGWNGWGVDLANTRFQPAAVAGLKAADVPKLKLKWAFGFANSGTAIGQPTIASGRLFFGSNDGTVYSLDARTGCLYWTYKAPVTVRTAISLGKFDDKRSVAYFGDVQANVYAVDARNGELLWKTRVDDHKVARVTGAPKLYQGKLYVPVSSIEEVSAGSAKYACCTFRGSVVALDAYSGKQIWKSYSIPDPPAPNGQSPAGTDRFGPAGGAIWSSPTIDVKRGVLYIGSGNQYSDPPSKYSDAIIAFDLNTGAMKWSKQMTPGDGWNFGCINPAKGSCPEGVGPDVDIGSSPILRSVGNGHDVLLVGQKSGIVHALDPDKEGEIVWQVRIGKGGALGGIMWGSAADDKNMYVPLSDWPTSKDPGAPGGLFALSIATGEKVWIAPPVTPACAGKSGCSPAQMAPATLIPGAVFSGSMDGHLRAYSTADGSILWDYDTLRDFDTVNGVAAKGGSMSASGPTIANGMLYVNSGYGALGGMPGNVLLAFSGEGK